MSGSLGGLWRYRVGDRRITCGIRDRRLVVLVLRIDQRREVYREGGVRSRWNYQAAGVQIIGMSII